MRPIVGLGARAPSHVDYCHAEPNAALQSTCTETSREAPYYPGLRNPGVYCFFNSVVQSLASVPSLATYLDTTADMAVRWDTPAPVTMALRALIIDLNTPIPRRRALAPKALLGALSHVSQSSGLRTLVAAHQQQDAHELAILLLGALDAELARIQLSRANTLRKAHGLETLVAPSALVAGRPREALGGRDGAAPVSRGTLAQRTACAQCGYSEAVRHFSFDDLSLIVPLAQQCTLEDCFHAWSQLEQIEWVCHRCSLLKTLARIRSEYVEHASAKSSSATRKRLQDAERRVCAALTSGMHEEELDASGLVADISLERALSPLSSKQVLIARPPPVLVVHLNRSMYTFGAAKNNVRVIFREWLDIAPYTTGALRMDARTTMSMPPKKSPYTTYRLSAIVTHYGSHNYGHYVSFRRRAGDAWYRVSDENVDECSIDDVLMQNPFLLFYEHTGRPAPRAYGAGNASSAAARVALGAHESGKMGRIVHRWHVTRDP
ncbi:ubiquitinyl hydrolase 1 [Malassezia cuniculi]|uniref:ubiquitinyl hydrolase 1 n=1 Tax=Malassezia cuniculi TaxID=948313 RepID=A0AAF0EUW8_9BASI|nr:ubiquitinyl hydrolase 1 [Malassezia cuniculi]